MNEYTRRSYYDHEGAYRKRVAEGHRGWGSPDDPMVLFGILRFIESEFLPSPGLALELGCGGAQASMLLAERGRRFFFATDFSRTAAGLALANAREAGVPIHPFVADAIRPLPIRPGRVSLVIDNHVRHCLVDKSDRAAFSRNAFNALCPGGVVYSTNMTCEGGLDFDKYDIDPATRATRNGTRYFASGEELVGEFRDAGFDVVQFELTPDPAGHPTSAEIVARRP